MLPVDAERIANEQLSEIEASRAPDASAWCRWAVAEYVAPAPEPVAAGADVLGP
ncbi:hypothetical protein [Streptomyces chryseus]|uniref:hypothetical protein n=1 Tax=Streptomyces chryseus TaxID=68186 RepID=UPI00142E93D9|nr:hypothetical protein [Streptomyces chryseus]